MRVAVENNTGVIIDAQSGGSALPSSLAPLYANVYAAGYSPGQFTVRVVSAEEFATMLAAQATPVPQVISDRQFYQQLAVAAIITEEEALAANAAVIPAALDAMVEVLPEGQRFAARMILSGATQFERGHTLTVAIGSAYGWTDEQIDNFFRAAAQL